MTREKLQKLKEQMDEIAALMEASEIALEGMTSLCRAMNGVAHCSAFQVSLLASGEIEYRWADSGGHVLDMTFARSVTIPDGKQVFLRLREIVSDQLVTDCNEARVKYEAL